MPPETTNLLPESRLRAFRRGYFFRVLTVAALFFAVLIVIHSILLFPTHLLLGSQVGLRQNQLTEMTRSSTSTDEVVFQTRLAALLKNAARIELIGATPPAITMITKALAVPHENISISAFSYTAANLKKPASMTLTGVAETRDALRQFQLALQSSTFVSAADLPVSTYAQETRIPFSIAIAFTSP